MAQNLQQPFCLRLLSTCLAPAGCIALQRRLANDHRLPSSLGNIPTRASPAPSTFVVLADQESEQERNRASAVGRR
jgi:hypothetical protein